ncbi:hypothetical protein UFOVP562_4 [uncultured Caudovirales phage]|uniref:Terminase, large subunit n=1 Tax=uncultured Caudovirales phage TaxID=2100421 RepID=A0A6J5MW73_9CAUD|nr:hypothetical protein UFOVP562_4 [uncultured Caudovirales phage]
MATQHPVLQDFRKFTYVVWKHLNLPEPTPVQYDIAQYLQHGPRRSVIEAFRGVGKSWLTSAFVCWLLLNNPQLKILVVSASKERADAFSTFVKRLINEIPMLQHLKPQEGQRDSVISFDVGPAQPDHSPSVKSVGITGQITGSRADILIADDVEVPNNSATQMMRDKLSESVKEFDAILKPGGRIIYLGTPQTEMSLYNQLPERGYEIRIWPSLYPELNKLESYKGRLAPLITKGLEENRELVGKPTDSRRFDEADLLERRASYGRAGFALQFMLDTSLSDGDRYPLKVADLIIQNLNPTMAHLKVAWAAAPELCINDIPNVALTGDRFYRPMWHSDDMSEYTGAVMSIDPSGRGKDETGYAVVKALAGNLFLTEAGGITGGYELETLEALAHAAKRNKVKYIIIEANFGDGMFTQLIKPVLARIYPCTVEEVKHSTQKEARIIDTLEPVMSTHRLIVDAKVIQKDFDTAKDLKKSLFYQMTRLTRDRGALTHDDRLDALAIAVAYWTESMARDNNKAAKDIRNQHLDKELKKFMSNILGSKPRPTTWM